MNILVETYAGRCSSRPDTTVDREKEEFYVPDGIKSIGWTPAMFVRISKAGKAVQSGFASRYYDSISFGVMMYPGYGQDGFCASEGAIFDHSTIIPHPLAPDAILDDADANFCVIRDGREIFRCAMDTLRAKAESAITGCSARASVRIGDFIAVELDELRELAISDAGECTVSMRCQQMDRSVKIIF